VPSPKVWRKYLDFQEKCYNSQIREIFFRDKKNGWNQFCLKIIFSDGKEYLKTHKEDYYYYYYYLQNVLLRPSCHNCSFKTVYRQSDITLADFWGIRRTLPEMYHEKGTSLVMVNSKKGKSLFDAIASEIHFMPTNLEDAIRSNMLAVQSAVAHPKREQFSEYIKTESFEISVDSCSLITDNN
jgi:hypothetical protein